MVFSDFDFSARLEAGIAALGYVEPTPIQAQAIPAIQAGRDVMGLAQTGTGKTAAFALPILQRLEAGPRKRIRALVVAPTRELAEQIHQSFSDLGRQTRLRSAAIYGGVGFGAQMQALRSGVEIVVACPGRLLDHVRQGNVDLSSVEVLVLDEADRMFDMGFLPDIRRIVRATPEARQTLLFSATMPEDIRQLASEVLHDPLTVQIGISAPVETVSHAVYPVPPHLKTPLLMELLLQTGNGPVLVFARTKHRAKRIAEELVDAGHSATCLQGNLSQTRRQASLNGFRDGKYRIMVATDIASRGIDVAGISHVINYDMPETTDAYTHRIGRTGRAEHTGAAYTLISAEDAGAVRAIEVVLGYKIERRTVPGFDYRGAAANAREFARAPRPEQRRTRRPDRVVSPDQRVEDTDRTANPSPRRRQPSSGDVKRNANASPANRSSWYPQGERRSQSREARGN